MMDREKAIRILEGNYKSFVLRHNGELLTVNELIALLKAQEPRVMTLDDLRGIGSVWELNTPPYLWVEIPLYGWTRGFWVAWREIYDMINGSPAPYDANNYCKAWRYWTSRPTDAQREAIPWN